MYMYNLEVWWKNNIKYNDITHDIIIVVLHVFEFVHKHGVYITSKYNFTEVQVSRVIIALLLQNCFVWCKDHTHHAILMTELLEYILYIIIPP